MSGADHDLLDARFLARLGRLALRARRRLRGSHPGEKRSRRTGAGLEFAGHRGYVPGDDLRHLDWALLGRLDRPFMKQFAHETELTVHLLLDGSRSMAFGTPSKWLASARIAAALAYIALHSLDRVGVGVFDGRGLRLKGPTRGRGGLFGLLEFLNGITADGAPGLEAGLRHHAASAAAGLTVVFSDFLDEGIERALLSYVFRRHTVVLVQILAREELDPQLNGDLKLVDVETGDPLEISIGPRERAAYVERLERHREHLRAFGLRYGMDVVSLAADLDLERALWEHLFHSDFVAGP